MIALAWEAGHAVIAALLLWTTAAGILAGLAAAAAVRGAVGAWRRLYGPLSASHAARAHRDDETAYRPPQGPHRPANTRTRKDTA